MFYRASPRHAEKHSLKNRKKKKKYFSVFSPYNKLLDKVGFFVYEFSIRKKMISFDLIALVIIFLRQGFIAQAGLEVSVLFEPPGSVRIWCMRHHTSYVLVFSMIGLCHLDDVKS